MKSLEQTVDNRFDDRFHLVVSVRTWMKNMLMQLYKIYFVPK